MTSKNYLCKSIKENVRRNFYLFVMSILGFLAALPIAAVMELDGVSNVMDYASGMPIQKILTPVQERFLHIVGPANPLPMLIVMSAAVVLGIVGFYWLYAGEKTDFYHTLPVKRENLFLSQFLSGFLIFLIPYLFCLVIAFFVGASYGAVTSYAFIFAGMAILYHVIYFLVFYSAAILAVMFTGNLFTGILAYVTFMAYGPLVFGTFRYMNDRFFSTLSNFRNPAILGYLSPVATYFTVMQRYNYHYDGNITEMAKKLFSEKFFLYGLMLAVLFTAAAVLAYRKRPSESYQKAIAFRKLQPVIKILCISPVAILGGLLFGANLNGRFVWFVIASLVLAVLLCMAVEFLYTMDIRECIRPKASMGIILAMIAVVILGYRMDVLGVDSYLPPKEKLESMSIRFNEINGTLSFPDDYEFYNTADFLDEVRVKKFDSIYEIAKAGVSNSKNVNLEKSPSVEPRAIEDTTEVLARSVYTKSMAGEYPSFVNIDIAYHLKSGRTVYRTYSLLRSAEFLQKIGEIYDNWEYRSKLLPTHYFTEEQIGHLYIQDIKDYNRQIDAGKEALKDLYKTYKTEYEGMAYEDALKNRVVGYLMAEYKVQTGADEYTSEIKFPIYDNFAKTLDMLKKMNEEIYTETSAEDVEYIQLNYWDDGKDKEEKVEDPEEIQKILEQLTFNVGRYHTENKPIYNIGVGVYWKDHTINQQTEMNIMPGKVLDQYLEELKID